MCRALPLLPADVPASAFPTVEEEEVGKAEEAAEERKVVHQSASHVHVVPTPPLCSHFLFLFRAREWEENLPVSQLGWGKQGGRAHGQLGLKRGVETGSGTWAGS